MDIAAEDPQYDNAAIVVSTQPVPTSSKMLVFDMQHAISKTTLTQGESLCSPNVPAYMQALKGNPTVDDYEEAVQFYSRNVTHANMNHGSVYHFSNSTRSGSCINWLGASTANKTFRNLRVSFKGICSRELTPNPRDYMTVGQNDTMRLTEGFERLIAPLEVMMIRRERLTEQNQIHQSGTSLIHSMVGLKRLLNGEKALGRQLRDWVAKVKATS
ncbi:hypothetical protein DSL72_007724 [Monilinia vaccinii-corymbosi]|uniref:Uncharacterized protein n=1 Tax=Monilinia vaccinii-corymbosi TaxID=61207 RepID=A0A8A3PIK4_9HELO|nr:hypothetical protein DSL72_007724 [Monilinia vaccinii-corymbosi]